MSLPCRRPACDARTWGVHAGIGDIHCTAATWERCGRTAAKYGKDMLPQQMCWRIPADATPDAEPPAHGPAPGLHPEVPTKMGPSRGNHDPPLSADGGLRSRVAGLSALAACAPRAARSTLCARASCPRASARRVPCHTHAPRRCQYLVSPSCLVTVS